MTTTTASEPATSPLDPVGTDLTRTLKALKLGGLKDTLARQRKMSHTAFLELVLADEVTRRESRSAMLRARAAGLDPTMRLEAWDELDDLTYDRTPLSGLTSLRFTEASHAARLLRQVREPAADQRVVLSTRRVVRKCPVARGRRPGPRSRPQHLRRRDQSLKTCRWSATHG